MCMDVSAAETMQPLPSYRHFLDNPGHRPLHTHHKHPMLRRHQSVTLMQATQESPTLARLSELTGDSRDRLKALEPLIPPALRPALQAGPIEGSSWCLLVEGNAAAAKVRQLLPALQAHLRSKGWDVATIRLKVLVARRA